MKTSLTTWAVLILTAVSSYAQGTLTFATRNLGAGVNAPVRWIGGALADLGPGPGFTAQLFLVSGSTLTPIASSLTTFQAPGTGAAAILNRYVVPVDVVVPGAAGGSAVTLRMRIWETARGSFEAAPNRGESGNLAVTLGGGGQPPGPPSDLPSSFTGFLFPIPEPSTIALGVLGAAVLLLRRRGINRQR